MKKLITMILVLMLALAFTACGSDDDDEKPSGGKDKKPTEQQSPTKGEDKQGDVTPTQAETTPTSIEATPTQSEATPTPAEPTPKDGMDINDGAREVADLIPLDLERMMPEAFAALGGVQFEGTKCSLTFLFKEELNVSDRERVFNTMNAYLKSISKDDKITADFFADWFEAKGREENVMREHVFVKIGKIMWSIEATYMYPSGTYKDGNQYPFIVLDISELEREK